MIKILKSSNQCFTQPSSILLDHQNFGLAGIMKRRITIAITADASSTSLRKDKKNEIIKQSVLSQLYVIILMKITLL